MEEAIARGVEKLDKWDPAWRDRVDTSKLNFYTITGCVLGQLHLFNTWRITLSVPPGTKLHEYGFGIIPFERKRDDVIKLTDLWIEEITDGRYR